MGGRGRRGPRPRGLHRHLRRLGRLPRHRHRHFLTHDNVLLLLRQAAIFSIVGIGATLVTLLGELDISFGATLALAGCVSAAWIIGGTHPYVGIAIAVAIGGVIGLVNGAARQLRADPVGGRHARHARGRRGPRPDVHRRVEHLRRRARPALVPLPRRVLRHPDPRADRLRPLRRRLVGHDAHPVRRPPLRHRRQPRGGVPRRHPGPAHPPRSCSSSPARSPGSPG